MSNRVHRPAAGLAWVLPVGGRCVEDGSGFLDDESVWGRHLLYIVRVSVWYLGWLFYLGVGGNVLR